MDIIWNYFSSWWKGPKPTTLQVESVTYRILTVTVLRAKTLKSRDVGSQSDLYVTLSLPTATATTQRTKTINNNNNPEWNETFTFRVPSQTKNVLEISVYDADYIKDDLVATVLHDLGDLVLDSKLSKVFELDPKTDVLEMEFELRNSEDQSLEYVSNGILMGPPLSVLSVKVEKVEPFYYFLFGLWGSRKEDQKSQRRTLQVKGAYKELQLLDTDQDQLQFHINQALDTELELTEEKESPKAFPLTSLPPQHSTNIPLTVEKESLGLQFKVRKRADEDLGVRLDLDIPPEEKEFLKKRKTVVAKALQTLLGLDSPLSDEQVPVIAMVASGGGARASTGFLGSLKGLKEIGVLDTVTYMSGVSGATWAMSTLCQDEHWSQNLETIVSQNKEQMTKSTKSAFSQEKINYYHTEREVKRKEGHLVSHVDTAGLVLEHLVFGQKNTSTLSDQRKTVKNGQNPLPIYTAVNSKAKEFEWLEFTPFEVGLQKYGAFVRTEVFGSKFFLGHLIKKLPEIRLPYLIGIWSSAMSVDVSSLWKVVTRTEETDVKNDEEDNDPSSQESNPDTVIVKPESPIKSMISGFLQKRPISNETFNFTRGLSLHQHYSRCSNFLSKKEGHPDTIPNQLTPSDFTLQLIDSGHTINIGCPPVLRPQRHVDIIIVLSNSWETKNVFDVLKRTSEFCDDRKVPFPKAEYTQDPEQSLREVYVFEDRETPKAPVVLFLPLVNASFKEYKEPGVLRETPEEVEEGKVDVSSPNSPYTTSKLTYTLKDYDALSNLTRYNVLTSRDTILSVIRNWIQGRNQN